VLSLFFCLFVAILFVEGGENVHNYTCISSHAQIFVVLSYAGAATADFTQALQLEPGNKEAAAALDRLKPPPKP
jgi:hypothetical protein